MFEVKSLSDKNLITKIICSKCDDSFLELIERHTPIFIDTINKYRQRILAAKKDPQEIIDNKYSIFYQICLNYDARKKTKFSTWLAHNVRYTCLNFINRNKMPYSLDDEEMDLENKIFNEPDKIKDLEIDKILDIAENKIGAAICKKRYFYKDKRPTWVQISKDLGISYKDTKRFHNEMLLKIKDYL